MAGIEGLADIPARQAVARGGAVALRCDDRMLTFGELERRSRAAADMLAGMGVAPGARVAWLGSSHEAFFEILFGAAMARACLTPINTRLAIPEIAFILDDSSANVLFVTSDYLPAATAALGEIPRWIDVVVVDGGRAPYADYQTLRDGACTSTARTPLPGDDVLQMYTSGTTGLPKGVRLTNSNFAAFLNTGMTFAGLDFTPTDIFIQVMPLFHVGGVNPASGGPGGGLADGVDPDVRPGGLAAQGRGGARLGNRLCAGHAGHAAAVAGGGTL